MREPRPPLDSIAAGGLRYSSCRPTTTRQHRRAHNPIIPPSPPKRTWSSYTTALASNVTSDWFAMVQSVCVGKCNACGNQWVGPSGTGGRNRPTRGAPFLPRPGRRSTTHRSSSVDLPCFGSAISIMQRGARTTPRPVLFVVGRGTYWNAGGQLIETVEASTGPIHTRAAEYRGDTDRGDGRSRASLDGWVVLELLLVSLCGVPGLRVVLWVGACAGVGGGV